MKQLDQSNDIIVYNTAKSLLFLTIETFPDPDQFIKDFPELVKEFLEKTISLEQTIPFELLPHINLVAQQDESILALFEKAANRHIFANDEVYYRARHISQLLVDHQDKPDFVFRIVDRLKKRHSIFSRMLSERVVNNDIELSQLRNDLINFFLGKNKPGRNDFVSLLNLTAGLSKAEIKTVLPQILIKLKENSGDFWDAIDRSGIERFYKLIIASSENLHPNYDSPYYEDIPRSSGALTRAFNQAEIDTEAPYWRRANFLKGKYSPHLVFNEEFKKLLRVHLFSPIETGSYNLEHSYPNSKARYRDAEVEQFEIDFSEIFPFIAANQYSIESLLLMIEYEKHYKKVFGRKENQHVDIHFDALDPNHFLEKILNEKKYAKQSEYTTILARFGLRALPLWEQLFHATNNPQLLYSAVSQIAKLNQNAEQFFLDQLNLEDPIKRSYATFGLYLIREKLKDPKLEEKLLAEIKKNVERSSRYAIMLLNETSRLRPEIEQVVIERQKSLPGGWSGYFQNVALKKVIRSYLHNYSNNYIAPIEIKIMRSNSIQSVATPITVAALLTNDIENEIDNFVRQDIQFQTGAISDLSNERMRLTKELDSLIQGLDSLAIIRLNRQLDEVSSRQSQLISASIKHALNDLESPKAFNSAFTLIDTVFHSIDTSSPTSSALNLMRTSLNQLAEKDPEQFRQQSYTYLRQYYRQKGLSEENEIEAAVRSLKIEASASFTFAAALKRVLERLYQRGLLKSDE